MNTLNVCFVVHDEVTFMLPWKQTKRKIVMHVLGKQRRKTKFSYWLTFLNLNNRNKTYKSVLNKYKTITGILVDFIVQSAKFARNSY